MITKRITTILITGYAAILIETGILSLYDSRYTSTFNTLLSNSTEVIESFNKIKITNKSKSSK